MYPILELSTNKVIGLSREKIGEHDVKEVEDDFDFYETNETAVFYDSGEFLRKSTFDIERYKERALQHLSIQCYSEAEKIFPESKQRNVFIGGEATANYPDYLQGETGKINLGKFIAIYQTIYHNVEIAVNAETVKSKSDVDSIIVSVKFPTGAEILQKLKS